ncbi:bifunctional protein-serine/threonine kinase/phosphatase [Mangrovicoccus algicola]|uniref:Protein kinase n=1 Tax=Mangrovicoccus algicola TaxID=2771008 RepID=A0A8J6Z959_9RHOB|nr:bifunctional protein-serine/threonine kinase/phosphatase [Mangrovicoccus algicola]MBE3640299.1 protein kinase [Mangrovicoccus algicola]
MPRDDDPARGGLQVTIGQHSSAGTKPVNQDFHGAALPAGAALRFKGVALALADGISPSPVSREAAELAVAALTGDYYDTPEAWDTATAARRVIGAINAWLCGLNRGIEDPDRGHVCTLAALILKGRQAHVLHVGDSRVARVAGASLEPLTEDHLVPGPGGGRLSRALGMDPALRIDHGRFPAAAGDIFVLTTDGVHGVLPAREIARLAAGAWPQAAAEAIVAAALAAGSTDNLTVQVARVEGLADEALPPGPGLLPPARLPAPGEILDGMRILRQVHASPRSHVFLALLPDGPRAALKIPAGEITADPALLARFAMEEWVARRVCSPHLAGVPELPAPRSALYALSNWVEGVTLRQWMTDHPRPDLNAVRDIAGQIARGLRALHRRRMVHQDLRPENVMIDPDGTVRLIDLGSVAVAGVEEAAPGLLGPLPGTLQYTAPEYFTGEALDWRADLYALGAITCEMLTGRLPYGTHVARIRSRRDQARLTWQPLRDGPVAVPEWMEAAIRRACHPDPLRRQDALGDFIAGLTAPPPGWIPPRHRPLMQRDPLRFWQAVSAILATGLAVSLATRS